MSKIVVVGSSNTDMVIQSEHLPAPGETILGGEFFMNPGGKGANQAVAAAKLGGDVVFVARVGDDIFGQEAVAGFKKEGINTAFIVTDPEQPSGVATIMVDGKGENCIAVASGANKLLSPADVDQAMAQVDAADVLLMQLETPIETIEYVAELGIQKGKTVILNPAPAQALSDELLAKLDVITPNETEAEILTGIKVENLADAEKAALRFARAAAMVPNEVDEELTAEMRKHWDDGEIVEIMAVIALFGYLNRWNDSMATDLEAAPQEMGEKVLSSGGWTGGKHV